MLCTLNLSMNGGIYSLKSTTNDTFLEKIFLAIYINTQKVAEEIYIYIFFFCILFCCRCLIWGLNRSLMSNKPIYFLLDDDYTGKRCCHFKCEKDKLLSLYKTAIYVTYNGSTRPPVTVLVQVQVL